MSISLNTFISRKKKLKIILLIKIRENKMVLHFFALTTLISRKKLINGFIEKIRENTMAFHSFSFDNFHFPRKTVHVMFLLISRFHSFYAWKFVSRFASISTEMWENCLPQQFPFAVRNLSAKFKFRHFIFSDQKIRKCIWNLFSYS